MHVKFLLLLLLLAAVTAKLEPSCSEGAHTHFDEGASKRQKAPKETSLATVLQGHGLTAVVEVAGSSGPCYTDPYSSETCGMTHQNAIMLIYVFSTFGLVLLLLLGVFYVCHLYGQRLDREARQNQAAADLDREKKLVPIKQACFVEQPDGQEDIAWAITTTVEPEAKSPAAAKAKVAPAAHAQLIAESAALQTARSTELLLIPSSSFPGSSSAPIAM